MGSVVFCEKFSKPLLRSCITNAVSSSERITPICYLWPPTWHGQTIGTLQYPGLGADLKINCRASLVAQWLRVRLPMQGTRVRALVWEDPTCRGTTGPVSHNCWACASGACALQQEKPPQWEACALQRRVAPASHNTEKACCPRAATKTQHSQK